MGYMGPGLPGQRSVLSAADRAFVEARWGVPAGTLHTRLGQGTIDLFQRMAAGEVKACWIICTNPVASVANRANVVAGLRAAELVIAQDAYLDTETNRYADILLPGALWAEAAGVMVNSERTLTLMPQAVPPPGDALPDWRIIAGVACEMGYGHAFQYASAAEVFDEIAAFANPPPATTCAAPAMRGCARRRCNGPARAPTGRTATRSAISMTTSASHRSWRTTAPARAWCSPPPTAARNSTRGRMSIRPSCPTPTIPWCSTRGGCSINGIR